MLQTTVHCHSEFVLHSLRNVEPVQVGVEQLWQTTVELPRSRASRCLSTLGRGRSVAASRLQLVFLQITPVRSITFHSILFLCLLICKKILEKMCWLIGHHLPISVYVRTTELCNTNFLRFENICWQINKKNTQTSKTESKTQPTERRSCVLCYLPGKSWQRCLSHRQRTREDSEPRLRCRLRPAQVTTKIAVSLSFCFSDVYKTDKAEREAERHKLTYLYCHQYDWWNMIGCLYNVTFSTNRLYRAIGTWNISLRTRRQEKHNKMM